MPYAIPKHFMAKVRVSRDITPCYSILCTVVSKNETYHAQKNKAAPRHVHHCPFAGDSLTSYVNSSVA